MRLDKYLKVSRLIKRRSVANEACDAGRVLINDRPMGQGSGHTKKAAEQHAAYQTLLDLKKKEKGQ